MLAAAAAAVAAGRVQRPHDGRGPVHPQPAQAQRGADAGRLLPAQRRLALQQPLGLLSQPAP